MNAGRRPTKAVIKQRAHECHRASSQRRMRRGLGCLEEKYTGDRPEDEFKCSEVKCAEVRYGSEGV
jgi:hypothetical protein